MISDGRLPIKATFISSNHPKTNYYNSEQLCIKSGRTNCGFCNNNTLLSFSLCEIDYEKFNEFFIFLPLDNMEFDNGEISKKIDVFEISDYIDYEDVNYSNLGHKDHYCSIYISRYDMEKGYLLIDISNIINFYKNKPIINLMFSSSENSICIYFNKSNLDCMPKLCFNNDCKILDKPVGIQLQAIPPLESQAIENNEIIKFNKIVEKTPTGIFYDECCGVLKINTKGYYSIQWVVNIDGSNLINNLGITLQNLTKNKLVLSSAPISIQGQLIGTALVNITCNSEDFALTNTSGGTLLLQSDYLSASLLVTKM